MNPQSAIDLYYLVWADAINMVRKHFPHRSDWKVLVFIFITGINALNLWTLVFWIKYFNLLNIPDFNIGLFPERQLNNFLAVLMEFALPSAVINYILIFYKRKYKAIIAGYKIENTYALNYTIGSGVLAFGSAIFYGILSSG